MNEFEKFRIMFSSDLNTILIDDKVFLNLRQNLQPQIFSLPQTIGSVHEGQSDTDGFIQPKKTTQFSVSSCKKYIAINQTCRVDSTVMAQVEVFKVDSRDNSCLRHESVTNYTRQCTGLQIDFHPCSPKLALILWEETEQINKLGDACERVRCIIWDLETNDVLNIGEISDFSACYGRYAFGIVQVHPC